MENCSYNIGANSVDVLVFNSDFEDLGSNDYIEYEHDLHLRLLFCELARKKKWRLVFFWFLSVSWNNFVIEVGYTLF